MERDLLVDLQKWKDSPYRKPLILRGARQTGKTWLLKEFGRRYFKEVVYVNFEELPTLQGIFRNDFDVHRILTALGIYFQKDITPKDNLIIFDEIQSAEKGLTALKYFQENAPQYFIVAAGSLLGMGLMAPHSFPVGKVNFLDLKPMSFNEFLRAAGEIKLADTLREQQWDMIALFHGRLIEYLRYYFYTGGMPEVVNIFVATRNWEEIRRTQLQLLRSYEGDFAKHAPREVVPRIRMVWNSLPAQLAKENKKFIFSVVREGARAKDFELAIQWLSDCGLLLKACRVTQPGLPLAAYTDQAAFKCFLHDVGLLGAMAGLDLSTLVQGDRLFTEFKGALTEQFVMQQLSVDASRHIGYWTNERSTSEVDFVVQDKNEVIPYEVKSGENVHSKSFRLFCEKYAPAKAIRTSLNPYRRESWMANMPLYGIQ